MAISSFCRTNRARGGVGIYLKEGLECQELNLPILSRELQCEVAGIHISSINTNISTVYRSPKGELNKFLEVMSQVLDKLDLTGNTILFGDFNVHYEQPNCKEADCLNLFFSLYDLFSTVKFKTRGEATLDNVYVNLNRSNLDISPIALEGISDHSAIVLNTPLKFSNNHSTRINYRPITNEGLENI